MNGVPFLPDQLLLVVSVFCSRPAGPRMTRIGLVLHAALLCVCLLIRVAVGNKGVSLACLLMAGAEIALVLALGGRAREPERSMPLWPLGAGVLAVWLAFRLVPAGLAPGAAAMLGIVLCSLVSLLFARDDRTLWASLLFAGHGVLLFSASMSGFGWSGLLMVVPLQAFAVSRFCGRPVWSDQIAAAPE